MPNNRGMITTEAVQRACDSMGGIPKLADAIGVSLATIYDWRRGRRSVSAKSCMHIERATNGTIKCEDLRPDLDWAILRQPL